MKQERSILAGGCFWGMQDLIRKRDGVISTRVGYSGGDVPNATYRRHGTHAEAIEIVFDRNGSAFASCWSSSSRSTIPRHAIARATTWARATVRPSSRPATSSGASPRTPSPTSTLGLWPGRVVTEVAPAGPFWEAEPEHQDYLERIPNGYTCHFVRPGWKLPVRDKAQTLGTKDM